MLLYLHPRMLAVIILGIASGLPLALTASTLSAMLQESGIDIKVIGLSSSVAIPYAFKYLWSPLVDNIKIPFLHNLMGHRRSWLIVIQIALAAAIANMGLADPSANISYLVMAAFIVAFLSATQDIVIDAFRIEILNENDQAAGAACANFGYRMGMLISGAGALYLATYFGWSATYYLMPIALIPAMIVVILLKEPSIKRDLVDFKISNAFDWLERSFLSPFLEFIKIDKWLLMLLLVMFYKLSDAYLGMMTTPFLLETGFTKIEIAQVVKVFGLIATFLGFFIGGYIVLRLGTKNSLMLGIILQSFSNLLFIPQAIIGHSIPTLMIVMSAENFCSGISGTALIALIVSITNRKFTATHYALLSSLAVFGRTIFSSSAGFVVDGVGWVNFFIISALLSLPAVICLYYVYYRKT